MPIANPRDAFEVEIALTSILDSTDAEERVTSIRRLFMEVLDYDYADNLIPLNDPKTPTLPEDARLVAQKDGVNVVYVPPGPSAGEKVSGGTATRAARLVSKEVGDNLLLLFTNATADHLHLILPDFTESRTRLRRLVIRNGEHHRTVVQQIANMWDEQDRLGKSVWETVQGAFIVEPVTQRFFAAYKEIFNKAKAGITGLGSESDDLHKFTQTLFNRLMFIYFISRKGWLRFEDDTDYLNALWKDYQNTPTEGNFYTCRLVPLFFAGLNNSQSVDLNRGNLGLRSLIGEVPFLNGGLFDMTKLDERVNVTVPDSVIEDILRALFDQFNFTVMESTPYDTEVAVDPEMLGKVFEELVTGRNDSGAYYTPRPVVSFMCREALKGYLSGQDTGLTDEVIEDFIETKETVGIGVSEARRVATALEEVTVVDPACGSGAYLLGMMQELVELQTTLYNAGVDSKTIYELKLEIIERNLYGADIDDFAVNIAMLRLWLSLAIEYDEPKPKPLPNLDFKILCGDSLLADDPNPTQQGNMFTEAIRLSKLGDLKREYMLKYQSGDKQTLREQIAVAEDDLRATLGGASTPIGSVEWQIQFADVFRNGGFDIAVANPPYIQLQRDGGRLGNVYKDIGYKTFARTGDIYQLFYERGSQLLKGSTGLLAYITSNSWLKAEYGKSLRQYFSDNHTPMMLLELGKDVFDSAIVDSCVLLTRKSAKDELYSTFAAVDVDHIEPGDFPPDRRRWGQVRADGQAPWSILSRTEQRIMDKMLAVGTPLKEWDIEIYRGITTGLNAAFIIDNQTKEALVAEDPKSAEIVKPVLRGRDIGRYKAKWAGLWLIDTHNGHGNVPPIEIDRFPAVRAHLDGFYDRLEKRYDKGSTPYNLRNCAYHEDFTKEKLLWIELVDKGRFAYDSRGFYGEATTFLLTGESVKFLCAVLNSNLIGWFLRQVAPTSGMGTLRWKKVYVERLPLPRIGSARQQEFSRIIDSLLEAQANDQSYDVSQAEAEIVEAQRLCPLKCQGKMSSQ